MVHSASRDNFLSCHGIPSFVAMELDMLGHQTFKDFEFIYIDTHFEQNKELFDTFKPPFVFKHVPVHPGHRYWMDRGNTYISAAKNTGILFADGALCITCDDAQVFPADLLQRYWDYYKYEGVLLHAVYNRMRTVKTNNGFVTNPPEGDVYCDDHRVALMDGPVRRHTNGEWTYTGTSFPLETALRINGFDERLDGQKSLEDCDFGTRLATLGSRFVIDKSAMVFILDHPNYADSGTCITNFTAVENFGVLRAKLETDSPVANAGPVTDKQMEIIRRCTLQYRGFDPLAPENAQKLAVWQATPFFNLVDERNLLRKSSEWKW